MNYIIGNIYYIIYRAQSDKAQLVLQPLRTFLYCYTFYRHTGISRTCFDIFYSHLNIQIVIINSKRLNRRTLQCCLLAILYQVCIQVTSYSIMRACIRPVRRDVYFEHIIAFNIIIFFGRSTRYGIFRQNNDSGMIRSDTNLIFRTNHTIRFHTTQFRLLNGKTFVTVIQFCSQRSYYDLLSCCHIGSATYDLYRFALSQIYSRNVHMIRVRMGFACQHFSNHQTFQTTFNRLYFFYTSRLKSDRGKRSCYFFRCQVKIDILFQPIIRDIHIIIFLLLSKVTCKVNKNFWLTENYGRRISHSSHLHSSQPIHRL